MRICLNPGHDIHWDSGAINATLGLRECDVVLDIGTRTEAYLEDAGYEIKLMIIWVGNVLLFLVSLIQPISGKPICLSVSTVMPSTA